MKKLLQLTKTLLVMALLSVGANAWATDPDVSGMTVLKTWDFTGEGQSITIGSTQEGTAYETGNGKQQKVYQATAPESMVGYFAFQEVKGTYGWWWRGSTNGLYSYARPRSAKIYNLKKDYIVKITCNGDAADKLTLTTDGSADGTPDGQFTFVKSEDTKSYFCTMTSDGAIGFCGKSGVTCITSITIYAPAGTLNLPSISLKSVAASSKTYTITNDNSSSTLYYTTTVDTENSGAPEKGDAAYSSTTNSSVDVVISSSGKLYAYVVKDASSTDVASLVVNATPATLAAPSVSLVTSGLRKFTTGSGYITGASYTINQPNNSGVELSPATETLEYTFTPDGGAESSRTATSNGATYTPTQKGTLTIYANTTGYAESSYSIPVSNAFQVSWTGTDFTTATTSALTSVTWGDEFDVTWTDWSSGLKASTDNSSNGTINRLNIQNNGTISLVTGWGLVRGSGNTYGYRGRYSTKGDIQTLSVNTSKGSDATANATRYALCTSGTGQETDVTTINASAWDAVQQLVYYSPASVSEADLAILDCKAYDTSATFATAIDAESFASAAEVYAFNTSYHITNGVLTDGVRDITGVIRNAAVTDGTDWNSASTYTMPTKYTGAPDNVVLDAYNYNMDAYQIIWGLPAGTYIVTANTRGASTGGSSLVYVNKEPWVAGDLATAATDAIGDGVSAGTLGYGFSTQRATFTITEATDIRLGFYAGVSGDKWASCDDWHLYRVESVPVTVSDAGFATYVPTCDLNFSDTEIKAYKVKVSTKEVATLTQVNNVPAGTPVLLYKDGGATEDIPVMTGAAAVTENDLVAGPYDNLPTTDGEGNTNMILNNVDGKIGFYFAAGQDVAANRAYLHIASTLAPDPVGTAPMMLVFADDLTGIKTVKSEGLTVNGYYDLQGRRVAQPTKGLYIVNGRKVVIK